MADSVAAPLDNPLAELSRARLLIWLDDLSRTRLADGGLAPLIRECHVVGVTGRDLTRLASVASFFISRIDAEIDQRLDAVGTVEAKAVRDAAGIANARLAFPLHDQVFSSKRWRILAQAAAFRASWAALTDTLHRKLTAARRGCEGDDRT